MSYSAIGPNRRTKHYHSAQTVELVRLAQSANEQARSELLARAARLVYVRASRTVRDRDAVDDLTQDVLLAAFDGLSTLRTPEAFIGWLRRITDNALADHRTRMKCTPITTDAAEIQPDSRIDPETAAIRNAHVDMVRAALHELRPRSRLAVELFHFHGLSGREVGEFLGASHQAARAVLSRARTQMKRSIEKMNTQATKEDRKPKDKTATKEPRHHMIVSGSESFVGPLFEIGSATDRLYSALYPGGDVDTAIGQTGMRTEEVERELHFLQEAQLVVPHGRGWRCTMPIASDIDGEIIRPWAESVVEGLIKRLDTIHAELLRLSEQVNRGLAGPATDDLHAFAKSTLMAAGAMEAIKRPLDPLESELRSSARQSGRYGSFRIALFDCELPTAATGAFAIEENEK